MGSVDLYQNLCLLIIILLFSKNNFGFEQHLDLSAKSIFLLKVRKKTKILGKYRNFSKNRSFRLVPKVGALSLLKNRIYEARHCTKNRHCYFLR